MKIVALSMLFAVAYAIQIEKEARGTYKYGLVKEVLKNDDNTLMRKDEEEDNVENTGFQADPSRYRSLRRKFNHGHGRKYGSYSKCGKYGKKQEGIIYGGFGGGK
ncbi:Hypothetical predicted protein [Paramuricea clavata]|uniref:Uncharacterized protein n=1 Tax=Paramuricea clavata TaxID=317549 RepID=A0A7D9J7P0_PARCT|nr:Hypothetical predicted protein [Paramuricea clavata]